MCLTNLRRFWPAKVGYQVKRAMDNGEYISLYQDNKVQRIGGTYDSWKEPLCCSSMDRRSGARDAYLAGFHVFHKLSDARRYKERSDYSNRRVVVKVKLLGSKVTGVQVFGYYSHDFRGRRRKRLTAKVTVCEKITLLKEIK